MFSWHGDKSFTTDEIDSLVTAGPISSGTYFSFLSSIFLEGQADIDYRGLHDEAGKQLAVFGYFVPISRSSFETRTSDGKEVMGYRGEFLADPETGEIERLEIETDDMPKTALVCNFALETRYTTAVLRGNNFRLPAGVVMDITDVNHQHTKTISEYKQCREFTGESVLRFNTAPVVRQADTSPAPKILPAGIGLDIQITSTLNPTTAWGGDVIDGVLASDVLDGRGQVLARQSTAVSGRLLRIEHLRRPDSYTVALQFTEMNAEGGHIALSLNSVTKPAPESRQYMPRRFQLENPPISDLPGACRFRLNDKQVKLKGAVTHWITK
jgi:hypothetical protein